MVYAFLADGFEETEAIAVIDLLRRAKVEVDTVSISDKYEVTSSHNFIIKADKLIDEIDIDNGEMLFLPGGIPGTPNLFACKKLTDAIIRYNDEGKKLAAICAAPSIFGELGILQGKEATVYPGLEDKLKGADYKKVKVVTDGNITTARGMGAAVEMGLELVRILVSEEESKAQAVKIQQVIE